LVIGPIGGPAAVLTKERGAVDCGQNRQAAGASYSLKVLKFFPALGFLAIRQVARLQALPYPLHDFAGAFLTARLCLIETFSMLVP
jgi:hypothetical protein